MSSYIRLEILLFFRAFETGVGMLVVYRLTDMLKRRLFCDRMWNSTVDILYWLLAGLLLLSLYISAIMAESAFLCWQVLLLVEFLQILC